MSALSYIIVYLEIELLDIHLQYGFSPFSVTQNTTITLLLTHLCLQPQEDDKIHIS